MLREDSGFIKDEIIKGGSGIYELGFGSYDDFELMKNDEYYSYEELLDEDNKEFLDEYYKEDCDDVLSSEYNFVKCVGYFEESFSVFVKVKVQVMSFLYSKFLMICEKYSNEKLDMLMYSGLNVNYFLIVIFK